MTEGEALLMHKTILIVENDSEFGAKLSGALKNEGYKTVVTHSATSALERFKISTPSAVIMSNSLPDADAMALLRKIQALRKTPTIVTGERSSEIEQLMAFAAGADDFLAKPFSLRLLIAHVTAVMRRQSFEPTPMREYVVGPLRLDIESRTFTVDGTHVELTRIEFDLLATLIENPRRVISREALIERVWGYKTSGDSIIESHLSRLRAKVKGAGGPMIAVASRGVGYKLGIHGELN